MWFYNGYRLTRYSYLTEEARKGEDFARRRLLTRLPFGKFKGQWKTLIVYNNQTKEIIQKYIDEQRVI